jgi:hypothetical protein
VFGGGEGGQLVADHRSNFDCFWCQKTECSCRVSASSAVRGSCAGSSELLSWRGNQIFRALVSFTEAR